VAPLGDVGGGKLPAFVGLVDPVEEPLPLLVAGDIEENLTTLVLFLARCRSKALLSSNRSH